MGTKELLKIADDLEQKYWMEMFDRFQEISNSIFRKSPFIHYVYDNLFEEHEDTYSLELIIGTDTEDHRASFGKPKLNKEELKMMILSLGNEFKKRFPSAKFTIQDDKDTDLTIELHIKQLNMTVNKDDVI